MGKGGEGKGWMRGEEEEGRKEGQKDGGGRK